MSVRCPSFIRRPQLSDFGFDTADVSVFSRSQWPRLPCVVLAIYRVVVVLYILGFFLGMLVLSIQNQGAASFVYLTTLAFMIFIAYNVTATVNIIWDGFVRRNCHLEEMQIRHKTHWFLFSVTTNLNFLVTIVYWTALYTPALPLIYDLTMHTLTSVVCLVDLFLTPVPVRFLHFVYPLLMGTVYLIFTIVFWAAGGFGRNPIYPFLDYSNNLRGTAESIVSIFAAVIIMQGAIWVLYKLRMWIWKKCGNATHHAHSQWTESPTEEGQDNNDRPVEGGMVTGQI